MKIAILGPEEASTGDAARRLGNEYLFQMLAMQNVEVMNGYGVKKIVTNCPHVYNTLANEYQDFDGNYEVIHHTSFIDDLIKTGKLKMSGSFDHQVAWHDSCYLGRYHDIYDAPRNVAKAVPGLQLVEMENNKSRGVCCGAGGARFWMEEDIGTRINHNRIEEAAATGAEEVCTACPFCLTMLGDAIKETDRSESLKARDIAEVMLEHLA